MTYVFSGPAVSVTTEQIMSSVYGGYIKGIRRSSLDSELRPCRLKALDGDLDDDDLRLLTAGLRVVVELAASELVDPVEAYGRVQVHKMSVAQVLFVDRLVKCDFQTMIAGDQTTIIDELRANIVDCVQDDGAPVTEKEGSFFAGLFLFQLAFDTLFVPDECVERYSDPSVGEYEINEDAWRRSTEYLRYTNRLILEASVPLRELCCLVTTGWSRGIDLTTWNTRNRQYYACLGETAIFVEHYDDALERMLPQFARSKRLLAEEVMKDACSVDQPVAVLEIGAGSGAFPIDLCMAARRLMGHDFDTSVLRYHGVEPSEEMRERYAANSLEKIGESPVPGWDLSSGSLEDVTRNPRAFLDPEAAQTWVVLAYSLHHSFSDSVQQFFNSPVVREVFPRLYVLDVVIEHGWLKPFYTWVDCESPECFDNVTAAGAWRETRSWSCPKRSIGHSAVTDAWCQFRLLESS